MLRCECAKILFMRRAGLFILTALVFMPFHVRAEQPGPARDTKAQQVRAPSQATARSQASTADENVSVHENMAYGNVNGHDLLLDVYEPAESSAYARPALLLIHGGGWSSFDKGTMRNMGKFLARSGFVSFSVDYRLLQGTENRWPAQLDDVQRAVRWVRANATRYGVDADHIGAFGHSAGAQLAALLGMEDTRDNSDASLAKYSSRVQAVVDVSGPTDFTANREPDDEAFLANFLGGDFATHPELWRDASPVFHVATNDAPFLIIHGTQDTDVPIAQAEELYEKLQAAGVAVQIVKLEDVHTFRTPEARARLVFETFQFFQRYLIVGHS